MKRLFLVLATLVLLSLGMAAQANLITAKFTGKGSGSLDGMSFSNSNFTITAVTDTANRYVDPWLPVTVYTIDNISASITIQNLGTYTFLTATRMFNAPTFGTVGFSRCDFFIEDLFDMIDPALYNWDMLTSIGPVNVERGVFGGWGEDVHTSGGILAFTDQGEMPATFSAEVVPEPSSIIVLASALVGLLNMKRRWA